MYDTYVCMYVKCLYKYVIMLYSDVNELVLVIGKKKES